jgi:hypothetical protein
MGWLSACTRLSSLSHTRPAYPGPCHRVGGSPGAGQRCSPTTVGRRPTGLATFDGDGTVTGRIVMAPPSTSRRSDLRHAGRSRTCGRCCRRRPPGPVAGEWPVPPGPSRFRAVPGHQRGFIVTRTWPRSASRCWVGWQLRLGPLVHPGSPPKAIAVHDGLAGPPAELCSAQGTWRNAAGWRAR